MKNYEIMRKILKNAGEIQYDMNIFNSCEDYYISREDGKVYIMCTFYNDFLEKYEYVPLAYSSSMFILKGRNLKSGLSSPMARYHAWNYINKHE